MLESLLYVSSIALTSIFTLIAIASLRAYRRARTNCEAIIWISSQLERAIEQIESENEDDILAGLQTLVTLKSSEIQLKALPRLNELAQSNNPVIASHAKIALKKLLPSRKD
jgi:hypothetical protein